MQEMAGQAQSCSPRQVIQKYSERRNLFIFKISSCFLVFPKNNNYICQVLTNCIIKHFVMK
jgi:hypothetical protein